ncbi:hypothetical protein ACU19_08600 [Actinobaculum suis]|uniref:D-alanyl-D-alanine carboxypeptidase/D-alanyl-D-alanine-endopeptidase n=1 Tax=Actinobaculum suis TaxID=1657 RepID=UPI00066FD397|nr:D-alanyl-D-alanine carboxypeptidase [Actinobaculum suis]KMY22693.1 hypothetical protein ACU19_08600 [Actinobaculum suis]
MKKSYVVAGVVITLLSGYGALDAMDVVPGPLTVAPSVEPVAAYPQAATLGAATPALAPANETAEKYRPRVEQALQEFAADPRATSDLSVVVRDPASGQTLASLNPDTPRIPASNQKLLTAVAALHVLGPDTTFPTVTRLDGTTLYLVGGGDNLLSPDSGNPEGVDGHAGLGELASSTAARLKESGITSVDLRVDGSLFTGPAYNPRMHPGNQAYIMEMAPLAVHGSLVPRHGYQPDPAGNAALVFADRLHEEGIEVRGVAPAPADGGDAAANRESGPRDGSGPQASSGSEAENGADSNAAAGNRQVAKATAPETARELARVESATVRQLLDYMLTETDNTTAQTLGHLMAVATGQPADFEGAAKATRTALTELGLPLTGVEIADNSGLSDENRVTAKLQVAIIDAVYSHQDPTYGAIGAGLPVSGLNGTLDKRLGGPDTGGKIRGKTGTLAEAVSISGVLTTRSGNVLEYSILVNGLEDRSILDARAAEDEFLGKLVAVE